MTEERIIAYLLEELTDAEREQFEEECWAAESWPEELGIVESELIEAYLHGTLSPERRQRFEEKYLVTAARRERVAFMAVLEQVICELPLSENTTQTEKGVNVAAAFTGKNTATDETPLQSPSTPTWSDKWRAWWRSQSMGWRMAGVGLLCLCLLGGLLWVLRRRAREASEIALQHSSMSRNGTGNIRQVSEPVKVTRAQVADSIALRLDLPTQRPAAVGYCVVVVAQDGTKSPCLATSAKAEQIVLTLSEGMLVQGEYRLHLFAVQADSTKQRVAGDYALLVE